MAWYGKQLTWGVAGVEEGKEEEEGLVGRGTGGQGGERDWLVGVKEVQGRRWSGSLCKLLEGSNSPVLAKAVFVLLSDCLSQDACEITLAAKTRMELIRGQKQSMMVFNNQ